ncbi:helix-turn-helix domain-containing protein [Actinokineospora sp.]|uniref:helix-turn-helix domain-containing protein n=1 Tax=Actinokineospora sp. TaxID=1872133 RepID=UPI0040383405
MLDNPNTNVQLRQVGYELRRHRVAARKTSVQAAEHLGCSHSKVSKIENGLLGIRTEQMITLLAYYEVADDVVQNLIKVNDQPRKRQWWEPYRDAVPDWFRRYVSLEAACSEVKQYQTEAVPGLLQVEDYARAVLRAWEPDMGDQVLRNPVDLRMARQAILTRDDPAQYTAVLSESALLKIIGDKYTMARQFAHLLEVCELPNVDLHVLPFDAPPHPVVPSAFSLLNLPDTDDSIVYLEDVIGATYPESPAEVGRYTLIFNRLRASAMDPDDSRALIAKVAEKFP